MMRTNSPGNNGHTKKNNGNGNLTGKQERFVQEYIIDFNASRAAIEAGYSKNSAYLMGHTNIKNHKVRQAIEGAMKERESRTQITQDMVVQELAKLAFSNMSGFIEWGPDGVKLKSSESLPEDATACVAEVNETNTNAGTNIKFKLHDKKGALELLGKHLGIFIEKMEHTGKGGGPIEVGNAREHVESRIASIASRIREKEDTE